MTSYSDHYGNFWDLRSSLLIELCKHNYGYFVFLFVLFRYYHRLTDLPVMVVQSCHVLVYSWPCGLLDSLGGMWRLSFLRGTGGGDFLNEKDLPWIFVVVRFVLSCFVDSINLSDSVLFITGSLKFFLFNVVSSFFD